MHANLHFMMRFPTIFSKNDPDIQKKGIKLDGKWQNAHKNAFCNQLALGTISPWIKIKRSSNQRRAYFRSK